MENMTETKGTMLLLRSKISTKSHSHSKYERSKCCRRTQHFNLSMLIQHIIGLILIVIIVMVADIYGKFNIFYWLVLVSILDLQMAENMKTLLNLIITLSIKIDTKEFYSIMLKSVQYWHPNAECRSDVYICRQKWRIRKPNSLISWTG